MITSLATTTGTGSGVSVVGGLVISVNGKFGVVTITAADITTGSFPASVMPAFTGDMTTSAGSTVTTVSKIGGQSVSLGGSFTVSGAFTTTFTVTGNTSITLPTSFGTGVTTALGNAVNGASGLITYSAFAPASGKTLTLNNTLTLVGTDSTTMTFPPASANVGYLEIPQNSQSANYTCVLADSGKHILHPSSDNNPRTFTIPANGSVAYPVGTVLTFINAINTLTIAITTDTMYLAGQASTTGSRTLSAYGVATATKIASTTWVITGVGLT